MHTVKIIKSDNDKLIFNNTYHLGRYIDFFSYDYVAHRNYIAVIDDGNIIGLAGFVDVSFRTPGSIGVSFISTHGEFRNQGVSKLLIDGLFKYAQSLNLNISNTCYEPDGLLYLKHTMTNVQLKYPTVKLFERDW